MNPRNHRRIWQVADYVFMALYIVEFFGAGVIAMLEQSFFAYDIFNATWADALFFALVCSLYVTAFVQNVLRSREKWDVIVNVLVLLGSMATLMLMLLGYVMTLVALVYGALMTALVGCRYMIKLRGNENAKGDIKQGIAVAATLLIAMSLLMNVEFVKDTIWLWALVPGIIISAIAGIVVFALLRKVWGKIYPTKGKAIGNAIMFAIIILFTSYMYGYTALGTANCAFDKGPTATEYVVLEKKISSGGRGSRDWEVKINIDGKELWIDVPVADYYEIAEGDLVIIHYHKGALGWAYYDYYDRA